MITIKAPIDLSIRTDYLQENDTFAERITGNYELMGLEIGEEELLHMVSAPPESVTVPVKFPLAIALTPLSKVTSPAPANVTDPPSPT